jgi:hypothetical protein
MAEDGGNRPSGSAPEQRELVGVADAGRLGLDEDLASLRPFQIGFQYFSSGLPAPNATAARSS